MVVLNLFALRAVDPKILSRSADPVGPENDLHIGAWGHSADVIVAWGNGGALDNRQDTVLKTLGEVKCLGITNAAAPRHPLYVRGGADLQPYKTASEAGLGGEVHKR